MAMPASISWGYAGCASAVFATTLACADAAMSPAEEAKKREAEKHQQETEARTYSNEQRQRIARISAEVAYICAHSTVEEFAKMVECGDFLPDETACGGPGELSCNGPWRSCSVSTGGSFSNPSGLQIDGEYILQSGTLNGKAYWRRSTGGMYLRWASMWKQWTFDDDTVDDTTSVAWIPASSDSEYPEAGTFVQTGGTPIWCAGTQCVGTNVWRYGSTAGNTGVQVPSLTIVYGNRRQLGLLESEPQAQCVDTPGWVNGWNGDGWDCDFYANGHAEWGFEGWCANGAARAGSEWSLGEEWNFPERNCCACGKPAPPRGSLHLHEDVRLILFKALEILDLWCTTDIPQDPQHNTIKCMHNHNGGYDTFLVPPRPSQPAVAFSATHLGTHDHDGEYDTFLGPPRPSQPAVAFSATHLG